MISNFNPTQAGGGSAGVPFAQGKLAPISAADLATMLDAIAVGRFNTAGIAIADGQGAELQLTSGGFLKVAEQFAPQSEDNTNGVYAEIIKPLAVSTYCKSQSTNNGAANATNVKASAGNLFSLWAYNDNANPRWVFFVNTAGTPVAGSASALCPLLVPAKGWASIGEDELGTQGINFATGIGIAMMTTVGGGTLGTAGESFWTATFK